MRRLERTSEKSQETRIRVVVKGWELFRVECEGESLTVFLLSLLLLHLSLPPRALSLSSSLPQPMAGSVKFSVRYINCSLPPGGCEPGCCLEMPSSQTGLLETGNPEEVSKEASPWVQTL